jgi:hypothetical protein
MASLSAAVSCAGREARIAGPPRQGRRGRCSSEYGVIAISVSCGCTNALIATRPSLQSQRLGKAKPLHPHSVVLQGYSKVASFILDC